MQSDEDYEFTNAWFDGNKAIWAELLSHLSPGRILEVGSFEGNSTAYLIESLAKQTSVEIHCVDTWQGGVEHREGGSAQADMEKVEARFYRNIRVAQSRVSHPVEMVIHKGESGVELSKLISQGMRGYFDFIYIDGSHQAPDVLLDAVLGFELLGVNGVIVFDDYLWQEPLPGGVDPIRCPKLAIDAFTTIYCRKIRVISAPLYQLYVQKVSL